jgi:hypothetical protein
MPATSAPYRPVLVEKARVLDVDMRYYLLSVATEVTRKPITVPFATPYQHFANGEGIYFMPEVGSVCWLCTPSDGSRAFVIAWASAMDEGDYRARKRDLNPGDIYLGTRDENFILLRRGGVVQVGSGPICQRFYLPVNNTIRDFCENYEMRSIAGELSWTVDRSEKTTDGKRPARFRLSAREFANDPAPVAALEIGSHDGDADAILTLVLNESGASGAKPKITLRMTKHGEVSWTVEGLVRWTFKDAFEMRVTGNMTLHSDKTALLEGGELAKVSGAAVVIESKSGQVAVSAAGGVAVTNPNGGPAMTVGAGRQGVARASPIISWMIGHTHPVPSLGESLPSVFPIPPDITSPDLLT